MSKNNPVEFLLSVRDVEQSTRGTLTSAQQIKESYANVHNYGFKSVQTMGGTFYDLPGRAHIGRDPEEFCHDIGDHFKGMEQAALFRGEIGQSPNKRHSLDGLVEQVKFLAECGVTRLQNFNALNTIEIMRGVPMACDIVNDQYGHNIHSQGMIVVQENPDTLSRQGEIIDSHLRFAEKLLETGHTSLSLKNANGVLRPDFAGELISKLNEEFGVPVSFHTHNSYGLAYENALAAIEADVAEVDVAVDPLADGTGQMSVYKLVYAMQNSPSQTVRGRVPVGLDFDAMDKDRDEQVMLRGRYSHIELPFDRELLAAAKEAGSAGGALTSLKGTMGPIWGMLGKKIGSDRDRDILIAVQREKANSVRSDLGYPANVTPTENIQDVEAVSRVNGGGSNTESMNPLTKKYLQGEFGNVSPAADKELVEAAQKEMGGKPIVIEPIENLPDELPVVKAIMEEKGIENPTEKEVRIVSIMGEQNGLQHVNAVRNGTLTPVEAPRLPYALQDGGELDEFAPLMFGAIYDSLERHKLETGFYPGIENVEGLIGVYDDAVREQMSEIGSKLIEGQFDTKDASKINRSMISLAIQIGVPDGDRPQIDASVVQKLEIIKDGPDSENLEIA